MYVRDPTTLTGTRYVPYVCWAEPDLIMHRYVPLRGIPYVPARAVMLVWYTTVSTDKYGRVYQYHYNR